MRHWNQSNFEGLHALSAALDAHDDLGVLAEYCRLREAGLRREAFAALNRFLAMTDTWAPTRARDAVETILTLHARTPECHQFLAQPLAERFVFPVLERWAEAQPGARAPIRWLGILRRDLTLLARVLAADPNDHEVRRQLIEHHLSNVDYATHHLGESLFLGEPGDALSELGHASRLIGDAPDRDRVADLHEEARTWAQMLADWQAYEAHPAGTFPEWCAARGRQYAWQVAVYYRERAP